MVKDMVSVIIPVYNGVAWIEECIESVLAQTWKELEILVLDDQSTDGTTEVVKKLAAEDDKIRLISRNSKGISGARNEGIVQSRGEYITFVDADDKLDDQMLETLVEYLQKENSDMVSCGYHRWNGDPLAVLSKDKENVVKTVDRETYVTDYLLRQHTHCWGVLYKRTVIEGIAFRSELTIGEDMMFLVDLLPKLNRITITNYKGYYYRINENGVTLRPFVPAYMDEVKSWKLATEVIRRDFSDCIPQIEAILAVSAILVAGKISALPIQEIQKYKNYVEECHRTVKEALRVQGVRKNLPAGYGIKTMLFVRCPWIYLKLYHLWKSR